MDKEKEIEKLKALLLEKSSLANVEPVFTDENGKEYTIDDKRALKVLNDILEQAFIPFIAEQTINAGYGNVKQAVKDFAERLKKEFFFMKTTVSKDAIYQFTDSQLERFIKELYNDEER